MAGGLMQLITYGSQDVYLTGNPQVTFFKVVYRRHTNFSMETVEQPFNSGVTPAPGLINTCIISSSGDLVHDIWIEDKDHHGTEGDVYRYIDNVEVEIGGQLIDKQHGDWNAVWWNLTTPESKVGGLADCFMGNVKIEGSNKRHHWYPLQFWFCKNIGLALPLIALQYSEVKLKIQWGSDSRVSGDAIVLVNFIFLDTDERRRFAQVSHEYLIEQVQRIYGPADTKEIRLDFEHPVKELIWVNDNTPPGSASGATCNFSPMGDDHRRFKKSDRLECKIQFNGDDRFSYRPSRYFKIVQPLQYHTRVPGELGPIKIKTFILAATLNQDQENVQIGGCYLDRKAVILETKLEPLIVDITNYNATATLIAGEHINDGGDIGIDDTTTRDLSDAVSVADTDYHQAHDGYISDDETFGLRFAHTGAQVNWTTIDFEIVLLTVKYRELNRLIDGDKNQHANIYVYSFSLKPEEHQPSGTCNFSRVDNAKLITTENFGLEEHTYKIFAHNYNVFRVMSGIGGLAYSN